MRARPRLRASFVPGPSLDDATVRAMWELRVGIFPLKPEVDPSADRDAFTRRVRLGQETILLHDRAGVLRGMFSLYWEPSPDGRALWLMPEYGYLDPAHRGDPVLAFALLRFLARLWAHARGRPVWFAGIGYPRSWQSLARPLGDVHSLADDDLPDDARRILEHLHATFAATTWDRSTHRVWLPTLPRETRPDVPSDVWRRFEAVCPDWADGYGVGLAAPITVAVLARGVRESATRIARRVRAVH